MNRTDFWASNGNWETFLTAYEGDRWRAAAELPNSSTRPDGAFELTASGSGIAAVWSNDNRRFPGAGGTPNLRRNEVEFGRMDGDGAPPPSIFEAFSEPAGTAAPVHLREADDVQRARAYRITAAGAELRILRGDFHRHTEISPDGAGDSSLEDYFRYMLDAARMDTGIVSDHNAGGQEYTWWRTEKAIDLFHVAGGFTPLFGYERSVPYPNGHRNVVFAQRGVKEGAAHLAGRAARHRKFRTGAVSVLEAESRNCHAAFARDGSGQRLPGQRSGGGAFGRDLSGLSRQLRI